MSATFIAFYVSLLLGCGLGFTQPMPVPYSILVLCIINSTLCLRYSVQWLTSRIDPFDPLGLLGTFGGVFFLVSPIIQIGNDYWPFIPPLTNHESYLVLWNGLNTIGLVIFTLIVSRSAVSIRPLKTYWRLDYQSFLVFCLLGLAVALIFQGYIFAKFGGISGFVNTFSERQEQRLGRTDQDPFNDLGFPMLIAESFKYIFAMLCITYYRNKRYAHNLAFFSILMLIFIVVFLIFGGLRGSRSSTVFSLIFAAGMYHLWIKPIPMKAAILGIAFVFSFLNAYYWYKIGGVDGLAAIFDQQARSQFASSRQDNNLYVFSRDLGRMDIQASAMVARDTQGLPYNFGLTYAGAPFTIIPSVIVPFKPEALGRAKSDIVFGPNQFDPKYRLTTIVFGMAGEAFINFGYLGFIGSFAVLAMFTTWVRRRLYGLQDQDARKLLIPVFCLLPVNILLVDSGLIVMILSRALLIPSIILMASVRISRTMSGEDLRADPSTEAAFVKTTAE